MAHSLLRFIAVGICGFSVDCGLLLILVPYGWPIPLARLFSFSAAVIVTGLLHRYFTFPQAKSTAIPLQAKKHTLVQILGAVTNLTVFCVLQASIDFLQNKIALTLGLSAIVALFVNYTLSRLWVFPAESQKISRAF